MTTTGNQKQISSSHLLPPLPVNSYSLPNMCNISRDEVIIRGTRTRSRPGSKRLRPPTNRRHVISIRRGRLVSIVQDLFIYSPHAVFKNAPVSIHRPISAHQSTAFRIAHQHNSRFVVNKDNELDIHSEIECTTSCTSLPPPHTQINPPTYG